MGLTTRGREKAGEAEEAGAGKTIVTPFAVSISYILYFRNKLTIEWGSVDGREIEADILYYNRLL